MMPSRCLYSSPHLSYRLEFRSVFIIIFLPVVAHFHRISESIHQGRPTRYNIQLPYVHDLHL